MYSDVVTVNDFKGKVALVTGASTGLGAGIARDLARRGASVVLVARREERLGAVSADIIAGNGKAASFVCDVTDEQSVKELAKKVKTDFGQLHLLVNNAGVEMVAPLTTVKPERARVLFETNVIAMFSVTKSMLNLLPKGTAIVNVASAAALQGASGLSVYAASKGAIVAFTRSLAKELAAYGIRVNAVAPGMVRTELLDRMLARFSPQQAAAIEAAHPLGFGTVEDVASAIAFLGGESSRWITGHTLVVDGGLTA